jgi:hypothetical protein
MNVIEQCRKIVEDKQCAVVGGKMMDMQTANCIVQFYDQLALRKSGLRWQRKMLSFPIEDMAWFAWNAIKN